MYKNDEMITVPSPTVLHADFPYICRVCLKKVDDLIYFTEEHLKLYKCLTSSKMEDNELPDQICRYCANKLDDILLFVKECRSNEAHVKRLLEHHISQSVTVKHEDHLFSNDSGQDTDIDQKPADFGLHANPKKTQISKCEICLTEFSTEKELVSHQLQNPKCKVKRHECIQCSKAFCTKSKLKQHFRTHTGEAPYECKSCDRKFKYVSSLKRHKEIVHEGVKPFICDVCEKAFATVQRITEHLRIHTGERPHACSYCGLAFKKYSTKYAHEIRHKMKNGELQHSQKSDLNKPPVDPADLECSVCNKTFSSKQSTRLHAKIHSEEKTFLCTVCGKGFLRKSHMDVHFLTHTGERPYGCDTCGKRFRQPSSYHNHLAAHQNRRRFECTECGKRFLQIGHLKNHRKTHTGEKPFRCVYCDKAFSLNGNLKAHHRTHTGEKPYRCDVCQLSFHDSNGLKKHKQVHESSETNGVG